MRRLNEEKQKDTLRKERKDLWNVDRKEEKSKTIEGKQERLANERQTKEMKSIRR